MKIALINGSLNQNGCTNRMLLECQKRLNDLGVYSDIIWVPKETHSCTNCRYCKNHKTFCCISDNTTSLITKLVNYDGYVVGSPVYYGDITSQLNSLLTRMFYSSADKFKYKVWASVTTSRRAGNSLAFARLNMFPLMHSMIVVGSQYWNEGHGDFVNEIELDNEGLQTMRTLADNMVYVLNGISSQEKPRRTETHIHTNFISREYLALLKSNTED